MNKFIILLLMILNDISVGTEVNFEHKAKYANYYKLGGAKIRFESLQEITSESMLKEGKKITYGFTTENAKFMTVDDKLYINGRLVKEFDFKGDYSFKSGILFTAKNIPLEMGKDFLVNDWGLTQRQVDLNGIKVSFKNYYYEGGGGGYSRAKGFSYIEESYIVLKIWENDCILWGVNYGDVKEAIIIDCLEKTVTIDSVKKNMILPNTPPSP